MSCAKIVVNSCIRMLRSLLSHANLQGLMTTWVANLAAPCHRQFGYAMADNALANFDGSQINVAPFGALPAGPGFASADVLSVLYCTQASCMCALCSKLHMYALCFPARRSACT